MPQQRMHTHTHTNTHTHNPEPMYTYSIQYPCPGMVNIVEKETSKVVKQIVQYQHRNRKTQNQIKTDINDNLLLNHSDKTYFIVHLVCCMLVYV